MAGSLRHRLVFHAAAAGARVSEKKQVADRVAYIFTCIGNLTYSEATHSGGITARLRSVIRSVEIFESAADRFTHVGVIPINKDCPLFLKLNMKTHL